MHGDVTSERNYKLLLKRRSSSGWHLVFALPGAFSIKPNGVNHTMVMSNYYLITCWLFPVHNIDAVMSPQKYDGGDCCACMWCVDGKYYSCSDYGCDCVDQSVACDDDYDDGPANENITNMRRRRCTFKQSIRIDSIDTLDALAMTPETITSIKNSSKNIESMRQLTPRPVGKNIEHSVYFAMLSRSHDYFRKYREHRAYREFYGEYQEWRKHRKLLLLS